jgi:hypothetical protein
MAGTDRAEEGLGRGVWTVAAVAIVGMIMVILDTTIAALNHGRHRLARSGQPHIA